MIEGIYQLVSQEEQMELSIKEKYSLKIQSLIEEMLVEQ